jgi:hypothetical protein
MRNLTAIAIAFLILLACSALSAPTGQPTAQAQRAVTPTPDLISIQATLTSLNAEAAVNGEQARLAAQAQQVIANLQASSAALKSRAEAARQAALDQAFGLAAQKYGEVMAALDVLTQTTQAQLAQIQHDQLALSARLDKFVEIQDHLTTQVADGLQIVRQAQSDQQQQMQDESTFRLEVLALLFGVAIVVCVLVLRATRRLTRTSPEPVPPIVLMPQPIDEQRATVIDESGQTVNEEPTDERLPTTVHYIDNPQVLEAMAALFRPHD